jgi:hypothetical protein
MTDFSHLEKYEITDDARSEYPFYNIACKDDDYVTLVVAPASEPNKPYFSALTRYAMKNRRSMNSNANLLEETRNLDRKLYADFVVKGWHNVVDADGKVVPFSKKSCKDFLTSLPNSMFDELREHCSDVDNFSGIGDEDAEYAAKNLESGSSGNSD